MEWNDAEIAQLKALWAEKHSAAEIARRMLTSKNSIVGKAHRLHLEPRPSPIQAPRDPSAPSSNRIHRAGAVTLPSLRASASKKVEPGLSTAAVFVGRRWNAPIVVKSPPKKACCWPLWGDAGRPTHRYCEQPCESGRTYCAVHVRRAHARPSDGYLMRVAAAP